MVLATITKVQPIFQGSSFLSNLFYGTYLRINIFNLLKDPTDGAPGYKITLSGLIVILIISVAAAAIAERLAGAKPGKSLITPVLITLLGAYIFTAYVQLPVELILENVRVVAALLGAIVFSVFYVLISKQTSRSKG